MLRNSMSFHNANSNDLHMILTMLGRFLKVSVPGFLEHPEHLVCFFLFFLFFLRKPKVLAIFTVTKS